MYQIVKMVMPHIGSIDMIVMGWNELQPPPSPTGRFCPDCGAPHGSGSVGTVCSVCHRGVVVGQENDDV